MKARSGLLILGFGAAGIVGVQAANSKNSNANASSASSYTPGPAPTVATDPNHVLHPQDVLRVQIFQEEQINKQCESIVVTNDLTISLPFIGVLEVKGKTIRQVQELIRELYDKDYLVNPQVNVLVVKYADRSVNVMGSVTNQGHIDFPNQRDLSIVDAIALAGGQTRLADLKHVKLTRVDDQGQSQVSEIDVDAMMKKDGAQPLILQPGDNIFVPERML